MTWVKDGKDDGTGTFVKGNPNNFWSVMLPTRRTTLQYAHLPRAKA
jgi:hypothetical protein